MPLLELRRGPCITNAGEDIPTVETINVDDWAVQKFSMVYAGRGHVNYATVESHAADNEYVRGWVDGYQVCYTYLMSQMRTKLLV